MNAAMIAGISTASVVGLVLVIALVIFALRRHKEKKRMQEAVEKRAQEDMNPVYGLYECDPDPQAEVEDTNDYYDCMDEEGVAVTRDNNSMYESDRE